MPLALFLSPHLDDVAFSCSATLLKLRERGFQTHHITVFTATMPDPQGFALHCQTEKGLAPEVDYMKLRRAEDDEFSRVVGLHGSEHWSFAEAPHRGYDSAPDLFNGTHDNDEIWRDVADELRRAVENRAPDVVFAPQGIGNHVDHLHLIRAVQDAGLAEKAVWYRDTPYIIREPNARPSEFLPPNLTERCVAFDEATLNLKIEGCCAYTTQIGGQFAGDSLAPLEVSRAQVGAKLTQLHAGDATACNVKPFAERLLAAPDFTLL